MKKFRSLTLALAALMLMGSLTGCGIVKVIDKGTEAQYTGETAFDAGAEAAGDWGLVAEEITGNAVDLASADTSGAVAVSFTGTVTEYVNKGNGAKCSLILEVDGVDSSVTLQVGPNYSGTTVRDCQTLKEFGSFTNQTEWSEYAKTLNAEVQTNVVDPLGDMTDESVGNGMVGSTLQVVGCAITDGDTITVTPVSVTAQ